MSDNGNNVHFSGVRSICSPYLAVKSVLASLRLIRALNESYALKMNIIVIFVLCFQCRSVNDDRTGSSDGVTEKNVSNDSQDNLNPLALSCWGLPPSVLEKYKNAGIKEMFPWQAECLMTGKVLQGGKTIIN